MKSIVCGAMAMTLAVSGCGQSGGAHQLPPKSLATCNMLFNLASPGCDGFKQMHGTWPNSLEELYTYRDDLPRKDAWGHDFSFTPYDAARGYGEVISYGRDGKPGGAGDDSDLTIRFPVKANADWNRQEAMSIKLPSQMQSQSNWFELFLN